MTDIWRIIAIVVLIALSAFFSASEMALASANRLRLVNLSEEGSRRALMAVRLSDRYDDSLSAILIGNNLVNVALSSISTLVAASVAAVSAISNSGAAAISTVIVAILIIIFGETVPKIIAKKNANRFILAFAPVLRALTMVLKPFIFVVVGLAHLLLRPLKGEPVDSEEAEAAVEEELNSIIDTVEDEGVIDEERSELLRSALDFPDISASEVMTARVDMTAIDLEDGWDEIFRTIEDAPNSRLPAYEGSIDNIIGVLYVNHFLKAAVDGGPVDIRPMLMPACFVYKAMKLPAVLAELRRMQTHLAIVTDDYGGTMGLITMEDVLEQLVGEIWDETDEVTDEVVERADGGFEIEGDMSVADFLELIGRDEDSFETESATVGGWTIESFGAFPKAGDGFETDGLRVTVLEMDGLRVERVLVEVLDPVG